jgi:hypothetical protein
LLDPTASARLFAGLDAPNLRTLKLNACALGPTAVPALCNYLRSRRSQTLAALELNANALSREGVADILSALEVGNFSIGRIQLFANDPKRARFARDGGAGHFSDEEEEEEEEEDNGWDGDDPTTMAYLITRRAPALNERNMRLGKRVRSAAVKSLVPLRLIMHARSPEEDKPKPKPRGSFPLLDLPVEVQLLIARHASRDAYALTEAQWARILHYAGDRATLRQRADDGAPEWLAQMRCELWELENQRYWDRL